MPGASVASFSNLEYSIDGGGATEPRRGLKTEGKLSISIFNPVWDSKVYSDFGKLSSSAKNVESASVPVSMNLIAAQIIEEFGSDFASMDVEGARELLTRNYDTSKSSQMFLKFVEDHGHRCLREVRFLLLSRISEISASYRIDSLPSITAGNFLRHEW